MDTTISLLLTWMVLIAVSIVLSVVMLYVRKLMNIWRFNEPMILNNELDIVVLIEDFGDMDIPMFWVFNVFLFLGIASVFILAYNLLVLLPWTLAVKVGGKYNLKKDTFLHAINRLLTTSSK